jgi:hypothetical protein
MPIVGSLMLLQVSPAKQLGALRSQYTRHTPAEGLESTHPSPGLQSAVGLHAAFASMIPAGRHETSDGLA